MLEFREFYYSDCSLVLKYIHFNLQLFMWLAFNFIFVVFSSCLHNVFSMFALVILCYQQFAIVFQFLIVCNTNKSTNLPKKKKIECVK